MLSHRGFYAGILSFAFIPAPAFAGGFYLQEQSTREIGRAFSGAAAAADNPSTIYYNPAGMTELDGVQISAGGTLAAIGSAQSNAGSTRTYPGVSGQSDVTGSNGGNPFKSAVAIPTFYASAHIGDSPIWLGLGVGAPFGLQLEYDSDFFGRYDSLESDLQTYNVQPSVAVKLNESFSIGGGVDLQYATVTLTNAVPNLSVGSADGHYRVKGDDFSVGWNLGLLAKAGKAQFGLHYRSGVTHHLSGKATTSGLTGSLSTANGTQDVTSPLNLPGIATASVAYRLTPHTRLMATGRHYNWSVFKGIAITPSTGSTLVKTLRYKDSWSISMGAEHDFSDRLTLRGGTMFDKTPTNSNYPSTRVPDGDRTWLSMGATLDLAENLSLDLSYAHVFISRQLMDRTDSFYSGAAQVHTRTVTRSSGNVDMVATALTARF